MVEDACCFCSFLDVFEEKCTFNAIDGLHEAEIKTAS
jgi:hypothetical protein